MISKRNHAPLLHPLKKSNTIDYLWVLNAPPDYAQEVMENIFCDVEDAEVYIYDIGVFSQSLDEHIALLRTILTKLQDNKFTVNPLKCEWAVKGTD